MGIIRMHLLIQQEDALPNSGVCSPWDGCSPALNAQVGVANHWQEMLWRRFRLLAIIKLIEIKRNAIFSLLAAYRIAFSL